MESVIAVLENHYQPVSLAEMDAVKLLDRMDTKFVFCAEKLVHFLEMLRNDYKVLEVNGKRISRYETSYLDTPHLDTYHLHQQGKLNRFKIRYRKYVETDQVYLETKFKNNKCRAIKKRVKVRSMDNLGTGNKEVHLISQTPYDVSTLRPSLNITYNRITLVHRNNSERLTIDTGLRFSLDGKSSEFPNLVIAEVKQDKNTKSEFIQLMHQNHIREISISKYCLGVSCLYPWVKKNRMKNKIMIINKVCHECQ